MDIQQLYIPALASLRLLANAQGGGSLSVSDIELYLPSNLPSNVSCDSSLVEAEWELRYAMAEVTLNTLRSHLLLRSRLYKSKDRHVRGQAQNTRSYDLIHTVEARVKASAIKYRIIRVALTQLTELRMSDSKWEDIYRELKDTDIKGFHHLMMTARRVTSLCRGYGKRMAREQQVWTVGHKMVCNCSYFIQRTFI